MLDINIAIVGLGLQRNYYRLDSSVPPHEILEWPKSNPDPRPTQDELMRAYALESVRIARKKKLEQINRSVDQAMREITDKYPRAEIDSWPVQLAEAEAYMRDATVETPFIDGLLANQTNKTKASMVVKILAKAAEFRELATAVLSQRQILSDIVDGGQSAEDINRVMVDVRRPIK